MCSAAIDSDYPVEKAAMYPRLQAELQALVEGERDNSITHGETRSGSWPAEHEVRSDRHLVSRAQADLLIPRLNVTRGCGKVVDSNCPRSELAAGHHVRPAAFQLK